MDTNGDTENPSDFKKKLGQKFNEGMSHHIGTCFGSEYSACACQVIRALSTMNE